MTGPASPRLTILNDPVIVARAVAIVRGALARQEAQVRAATADEPEPARRPAVAGKRGRQRPGGGDHAT